MLHSRADQVDLVVRTVAHTAALVVADKVAHKAADTVVAAVH